VPPGPTPGPTPSNITINLTSDQILGATRDPGGKVTLTIAQVQQVIDTSGMITVSGDDKFRDIVKKLQKCAEAPPSQFQSSQVPPASIDARVDRIEKAVLEFMKRDSSK
jgi:hypothetical protein